MPSTIPPPELGLALSPNSRGYAKKFIYAAVGIVTAFSLIPLIYLLIRAGEKSASEILALLLREKTLTVIITTATLVFAVTLINLIVGVAIACGLHFVRLPVRRFLIIPVVLPLAIPSYVFTYTWIALVPSLSGLLAGIFILSLTTMPYLVLATMAGLRRIDGAQIEMAQSLGLSKAAIFFRVVLPQIRGHVSAGALLTGLYIISDFGAVYLLKVETLTVLIQNIYRSSYDRGAAAVISILLIGLSLFFVFADEKFRSKNEDERVVRLNPIKSALIRKQSFITAVIATIAIYSFLSVAIPLYVLFSRFYANRVSIEWSDLASAAASTILVSAMGAGLALLLSIPLGFLVIERETLLSKTSQRIMLASHALPGVVIGLALVSLGSKISFLYQTTFLLAIAYVLLFLAKSIATVRTSLTRIPTGVKEVAATLGMNQWAMLRKVIFPIAAPSIGLGTILVFLTAMKELPATLMLRPTGFDTLATHVWTSASINRFNEAAPYALTLVIIAAVPTFFISRPDKADRAFINDEMRS